MVRMIIDGYRALWKHKWALFFLYLVQATYGFFVGQDVQQKLSAALSNSLVGEQLLDGYNSDIFADLMRHEGLDVLAVAQYASYLLPVFVLLSLWIQGGAIANISRGEVGVKNLFQNGFRFLIKFMGISLLATVVFLIVNAMIWAPFFIYTGNPFETYDTEKSFFLILLALASVSILITCYIAAWSIKAKSNISLGVGQSMKSALLTVRSNFWAILFFSILALIIFVLCIVFYKWLLGLVGGSKMAVFGTLVVSQLLAASLCKIRVWYIAGIVSIES